jgi:hypothetical protein
MRSRRQQHRKKQQALHTQRERRRLGRFVAFAEIEADLSPISIFGRPPSAEPRRSPPREMSHGKPENIQSRSYADERSSPCG